MTFIQAALALATLFLAAEATITLSVNCSLKQSTQTVFATLQEAQTIVRQMHPLTDDVVVKFMGICTPTTANSPILNFNSPLDSGGNFSITYSGFGAGSVLTGEYPLNPQNWKPLPGKPHIVTYDLTAAMQSGAFGTLGYGTIANGGLGACSHNKLELFFDDTPMILARYPNVNLSTYNGPWMDWMLAYTADNDPKFPDSFVTTDNHAREWYANQVFNDPANPAWLHGFWSFDWADNYIQLTNVTITNIPSGVGYRLAYNPKTPPVYGILPQSRFYIVNVLSELDSPGEYFIDASKNVLYFFPPPGVTSLAGAMLNAANVPLVSSVPLTNVHFSDFEIRAGRLTALNLAMTGGSVTNVQLKNFGGTGATFSGSNITLSGVSGKNFGCAGMRIGGGNPATLQEANNLVTNSSFSYFARWTRTYNPGISFSGVGMKFLNNEVAFAPHTGMTGGANNVLFLNNHFHDLCYEARDAGAFYIGRSWVHRGVVVANNLFERVKALEPTQLGAAAVIGVYLDDEQSGVNVTGNVCIDSDLCFLLGGGRDNTYIGNKCVNSSACINFDNRGMNWQSAFCTYNSTYNGTLPLQLFAANYKNPPYSVEYPRIVTTLSDRPCVPVGNILENNTYCNVLTNTVINQNVNTIVSWGSSAKNNVMKC